MNTKESYASAYRLCIILALVCAVLGLICLLIGCGADQFLFTYLAVILLFGALCFWLISIYAKKDFIKKFGTPLTDNDTNIDVSFIIKIFFWIIIIGGIIALALYFAKPSSSSGGGYDEYRCYKCGYTCRANTQAQYTHNCD